MTAESVDNVVPPEGLPNYVDYLENLLGQRIRENNETLIASLSIRQLNEIRERHHDAWRQFSQFTHRHADLPTLFHAPLPYRRKKAVLGEFRPILHGQIHDSAYRFGGDESHPWERAGNEERLAGLKRLLLYSHRVVLADPLWYVNQWLGREIEDEYSTRSRAGLTHLLDFVYLIKDLIRSDIILFYPQYEHTGVGFSSHLFEDQEFLDWSHTLAGEDEDTVVSIVSPQIIELLFYCVRYGASCFIDRPQLMPALQKILDYGGALGGSHLVAKRDSVAVEDDAALRVLARMSLPSLDSVSVRDIIAVRKSSDGFNRFRDLLKEGLTRIDAPGVVNVGLLRQAVSDSLAEGSAACKHEIRGSALLSKVRENAGSFAIGAVAGALMGDPTGGVGTGAVTACLTVLKEYVSGVKERTSQRALLRHYALWDPTN